MTTILKLGGSVITDKSRPETLDTANLERAVDAIAEYEGPLVLVHGGGSFGHHHASKYGLSPSAGSHDAGAALAVHDAMRRLNDAVIESLHERNVPALPVHPLSVAARDDEDRLSLVTTPVKTMLAEGFLPVFCADMVAHAGQGMTVVSGDELVVALATQLDADRVGLCSAVPGVLDTDGALINRIESFEDVADALAGSDATDVTGGMSAKVRALLDLDTPASVFGLDGVAAFFDGDSPGTRIE